MVYNLAVRDQNLVVCVSVRIDIHCMVYGKSIYGICSFIAKIWSI